MCDTGGEAGRQGLYSGCVENTGIACLVVSKVNYWVQVTQALHAILGILDFILGTLEHWGTERFRTGKKNATKPVL